jgi:hypothetical protein
MLGAPAVVSALVGVVLWLALVPQNHPQSADPRVGAFWWIMAAASFALGAVFGVRRCVVVGVCLALPQFVLAFWTAPRGDDDGLWVLWMPILLVFGAILILPAALGGAVRKALDGLVAGSRRRSPA